MYNNRAKELFEKIKVHGVQKINDLIENKETESYFLDFKRSTTENSSNKISSPDKKNYAKAISGFGNSEGGILIWGVDCSSKGDTTPKPNHVENPSSFADRLNGLTTACTMPVHRTVENFVIYEDSETNKGYVVSYIPKSNDMPHQCLQEKQCFYIRAGSNFEQASYGMLSRMFGVMPTPSLDLSLEVKKRTKQTTPNMQPKSIPVNIVIKNTGITSVHELFVTTEYISVPNNISLTHSNGDNNDNSFKSSSENGCFSITKSGYKLPPKATHQMLHLQIETNNNSENDELKIVFWIGAHGCSPKYHELLINQEQIASFLGEHTTHSTMNHYLKYVS